MSSEAGIVSISRVSGGAVPIQRSRKTPLKTWPRAPARWAVSAPDPQEGPLWVHLGKVIASMAGSAAARAGPPI